MREVRIKSLKTYSVYVSSGNSGLNGLLETYKVRKCFIITDSIVYELYKNYFEAFKDRLVGIKIVNNGKASKNLDAIMDIYDAFIKSDVNRRTHVVAIGGGVIGDLAGFAAATYMSGLPLIHIPTTLIAQCDSSIGEKNSLNFGKLENIVGTHYQPEFVYSDVNFLKTLNDREYKNGLAEVLKFGFTNDINLFNFLEKNKKGILEREIDKLLYIVNECIKIKDTIIEKDETDSELRNILNLGHSMDHDIKRSMNFNLSHGEAVALGMKVGALVSVKYGYLEEKNYNRAINLIRDFGLLEFLEDASFLEIIEFMRKDKRNTTNNVKFLLPDNIGHAIITTEIKQNIILDAMGELRRKL